MPMAIPSSPSPPPQRPRYLEQRAPIVFPESAEVPETQLHLELRTLLYQLLQDCLGEQVTVGSDQFVYYDAEDPSACIAPDVYVALTPAREKIRSWKVWERGAPEVAVEIISDSDSAELPWEAKLSRYRRLGVRELVRFDPSHAEQPLRIWDRVDGALREREVPNTPAPSLVLNLHWVMAPAQGMQTTLRIAIDNILVPTAREARLAERQARTAAEDQAHRERTARAAAESRVQELEAELQRRG